MEGDLGRYVLPSLLTLLIAGSVVIVLTSGGGDDEGSPSAAPATTPAPTSGARAGTRTARATRRARATTGSRGRSVTVRPGDTPTSIARDAGITVERLLELNPGVSPAALRPGQTLKIEP